jgi:hypothetical protein
LQPSEHQFFVHRLLLVVLVQLAVLLLLVVLVQLVVLLLLVVLVQLVVLLLLVLPMHLFFLGRLAWLGVVPECRLVLCQRPEQCLVLLLVLLVLLLDHLKTYP